MSVGLLLVWTCGAQIAWASYNTIIGPGMTYNDGVVEFISRSTWYAGILLGVAIGLVANRHLAAHVIYVSIRNSMLFTEF